MTESKSLPRPSQVTMAGWMALLGSALLVLTLFDTMARVRSVEMRDSIDEFLSTPPGNGLGISVAEAVDLMRGALMFSGAVAAAAAVLAFFVLQRNNGARIGFTASAAALLLTAPVSGGVLPFLVAFSAVSLWTRPARDWFAGRPQAPRPEPVRSSPDQGQTPPPYPGGFGSPAAGSPATPQAPVPGSPTPPPYSGYGTGQAHPVEQPVAPQPGVPAGQPGAPGWPQGQQPQGQQPYGGYPWMSPAQGTAPGGPAKRPTSVTVAAILTWVFAGATALVYLGIGLMLVVAKDQLLEMLTKDPQFRDLGITTDELVAVLWLMTAVFIVWSLVSVLAAVGAFRRMNWARITLAVSAGVAALVSVAALPFGLVHLAAAGATVVLLFTGGANAWFAGRRGGSGSAGSAPWPPYGGYPQQGYPGQPPAPQQPQQPKDEPPSNVW